jgi:signal transduction histidine kinase
MDRCSPSSRLVIRKPLSTKKTSTPRNPPVAQPKPPWNSSTATTARPRSPSSAGMWASRGCLGAAVAMPPQVGSRDDVPPGSYSPGCARAYARRLMTGAGATGTVRIVRWRAVAIDVLVAVASFAISATVLTRSEDLADGVRRADLGAYALAAVCSASVVFRRRAPVASVLAGLLAVLAFAAAQYPVALTPVVLLSVYTAAEALPARPARLLLAVALVAAGLATLVGPGPTDPGVLALVLSAWLLGTFVGSRRAYTAELERKNRQLEQARLDLADRAVAEERLRIARELHDVVAHSMSVVAVQAGTGRMVATEDPAAARQALATIETATRSALVEMRRLMGVLRGSGAEPPSALAPAPGLADIDALVADVVRSGVAVEVRVEGERREVPAGVDLSAYRIVQEALTNVIKHAGRSKATVAVRYADDAVTVEVDDEGTGSPASPPSGSGGGHGLVGMRERVAMYGGRLETGPSPSGGFRVAAHLPFGARP